MERLTGRLPDGTAYVVSETGTEGTGHFTTQRRLPELITRLAAYEDTGLEPEYIRELMDDAHAMHDELKRYREAEKSGRLVVLPTEDFNFTIRGDIALGVIIANCRAFEREEAVRALEVQK